MRRGETRRATWKVLVLSTSLSSQPLVSTQAGPVSSGHSWQCSVTDSVPEPDLTSQPVYRDMVELFPEPVEPTTTTHLPSLLLAEDSDLRRFFSDKLRTNLALEGRRSEVGPIVITAVAEWERSLSKML